jgi:hypothetical protein
MLARFFFFPSSTASFEELLYADETIVVVVAVAVAVAVVEEEDRPP